MVVSNTKHRLSALSVGLTLTHRLPCLSLSACLSVRPTTSLSAALSVCLSLYMAGSVRLPQRLSVRPPVPVSISDSSCPVCLSLSVSPCVSVCRLLTPRASLGGGRGV